MYISALQIKNYKSYYDSNSINLKQGFNLFVGKNNSGKTSLLESLSLQFEDKPHRSEKTIPYTGAKPNSSSEIKLTLNISKDVFFRTLNDHYANHVLYIPFDKTGGISSQDTIDHINECILNLDGFEIDIIKTGHSFLYCNPTFMTSFEPQTYSNVLCVGATYDRYKNQFLPSTHDFTRQSSYHNSVWAIICSFFFIEKIYCFKAERLNIGKYKFGNRTTLESNASNLPEVLSMLQSNPAKFKRYNNYVNKVFSEIKGISVKGLSDQSLEILTWTINPDSEREDLAIPLTESGTGIGQVLAMLYVVLEKTPKIIVIDELQSFLHPGASKKLIEILKLNPQHQYIIATHSSTIISATDPETITLIQNDSLESNLRAINKKDSSEIQNFLSDIGVRLSDIFGADNILWVEGPTEEKSFPIIIEKLMKKSLMGTSIVGVINTGDFEGQHKKAFYKLYKKLCNATVLSPAALQFIFDREDKTEKDITDLERESKGLVKFLTKRMYENYLLNPKAISAILKSYSTFESISEDIVTEWLTKNKSQGKYWKPFREEDGESKINAAKLLGDLFSELSDNKIFYNKTEHSVKLTEWLVKNSPKDLDELVEIFGKIIK